MQQYDDGEPINLGTGVTTSIAELAHAIRKVVGYRGELRFDTSRPDGMPLKGLDSSVLQALGWRPRWTLEAGLDATYPWFASHQEAAKAESRISAPRAQSSGR
jgi:GDP-L-fucose synthase